MSAYLPFLALTLLLEAPLARLLAEGWVGPGGGRRLLLVALLLNAFSHPLATLAVAQGGAPWLAVEAAVLIAEGIGYRLGAGLSAARATAVAAVCNGLTAGLGLLGA